MHIKDMLPFLLGLAVLLPLFSFWLILIVGRRLGKEGSAAAIIATGAIVGSFLLSIAAAGFWFTQNPPTAVTHADHGEHAATAEHAGGDHEETPHAAGAEHGEGHHDAGLDGVGPDGEQTASPDPVTDDWYTLGTFGSLRLTIGYYIDSLTICMFCMVTLISSCIHFYAMGYMHEELHEVTDHEVSLADGSHLTRRGRYHRFFQFLSLFCFSMLGLVVAGNLAMTFVFWELVGICSYFLIGFYVERKSASDAANKAFIVNRIGDFGMIIGLMILWATLGTLTFGDIDGEAPGIFSQVRSAENQHALATPDGMVRLAATGEVAKLVAEMPGATSAQIQTEIDNRVPEWRGSEKSPLRGGYGYWLLIFAGLGIFCGCVGKSAQFPLHVWLPDAMEGPTPVSALVHSATMVAAGVFLVARFYPVFTPEVLLVIAIIGTITLFLAATIAITATDIKRVLAYSTVSQLGYMMLALGVGGWLAGILHLFTHAFFKSLLFLCSGSVIHAVHTNEMPLMGGLRKKMPVTAYTMLVGCLAISGAGIPFMIGFSGYYSKDTILEQALSFGRTNGGLGMLFFAAAAGGAAITAFYMFRLWYMTFAGEPRDQHRYDHAHESPPTMYLPLIVLAIFAVGVGWGANQVLVHLHDAMVGSVIAALIIVGIICWSRWRGGDVAGSPASTSWAKVPLMICAGVFLLGLGWTLIPDVSLSNMLSQARSLGTAPTEEAALLSMTWPDELLSHADAIRVPATLVAAGTALAGFLWATIFYGWRLLDAEEARRQFSGVHRFLLNKWWFDELYDFIFLRPTHFICGLAANFDRRCIDWLVDSLARGVRKFAIFWERLSDQMIVDGSVNYFAKCAYGFGASLRRLQTGSLRNYVLFIVVGILAFFVLASFLLSGAFAS